MNTPALQSIVAAVEFGEYLAKRAEQYIAAVNANADAPNDPDAILDLESAQSDAFRALNSAIYEFRKRAALAAQSADYVGPDGCHGLDTPERVRFYEHDFYPLSNFSAFTLQWKGLKFDTSEAAYHWEKFNAQPACDDIRAMIRFAPSAHEAFKFAEKNKQFRRQDWDSVRVDIMRDLLRAKAQQHEYVRRKLLATGDRELVEDSWRDNFWGWGPNKAGQNMLGKLWMEIRSELRAAEETK